MKTVTSIIFEATRDSEMTNKIITNLKKEMIERGVVIDCEDDMLFFSIALRAE